MSKREIPIPERDDEFTDLDDELSRAIQAVEQHNKSTETALREFIESEESEDSVSEDETVGAETETAESGDEAESASSEKSAEPEQGSCSEEVTPGESG